MMIRGEGVGNLQFAHDDETGAVGEGMAVIGVLSEDGFGKMEAGGVDIRRALLRSFISIRSWARATEA